MGMYFSNLHIRKNRQVTIEAIQTHITELMTAQQFLPVSSEEEADGAFAIATSEASQWYSVYSDLFFFDTPKIFTDRAQPMSHVLRTDILGISCFDSDYLYMNLINSHDNTDAWAGIGSAAGLGIRRRSTPAQWKRKVDCFSHFRASIKQSYLFAEEVLAEISQCLHLPEGFSMASYEYLSETDFAETAHFLYFKLPDALKNQELPRLIPNTYSLTPCSLEQPSTVNGLNIGGASKGLSVYFLGSYVEHDEITFSDVCFVKDKNGVPCSIPISLSKTQLADGQWAYCYHDIGYRIPEKPDDRLPPMKRFRQESDRQITVRFVPHGNPRKLLDITVVLVPHKNPEGQTAWGLLQHYGSKKGFIEHYYQTWSKFPNHTVLKEEDFD